MICGGGNPFAEADEALRLCYLRKVTPTIIVGNDMIGEWPLAAEHGATLHPDKLHIWQRQRGANQSAQGLGRYKDGFQPIGRIWGHRPFTGVNNWTRDWSGSTGLFCVKILREIGFTHIMLCGVHMSTASNHFLRKTPWGACDGFKRAWEMRLPILRPYVRSFGGWTKEQFGAPTEEWLWTDIEDNHRQYAPPGWGDTGRKA